MRIELAYESVYTNEYNLSRQPIAWFTVNEKEVSATDELTLNCERVEGNQVKRTLTGDILFYDATKELILDYLINGNRSYMWIRVYDCDCNVYIFTGQITRDKIEWCSGECFLTCRANQYDNVTDAYNSLNNILNYDNYLAIGEHIWNFKLENIGSPATERYIEGARIGGLLKASIESLPEFKFKSTILEQLYNLNSWTGDAYDYSNVGVTPVNSENPYYFACLLNTDINKPKLPSTIGNVIRDLSKYIRTIRQFLDELKAVFNADYLLKIDALGNVNIIFERKDYFYNNAPIWKDCTLYDCCFEIDDRNQFAYANMRWSTPSELSEDIETELWSELYSDIVEWNQPVNPVQKEEYTRSLLYSYMPLNTASYGLLGVLTKGRINPPSICIAGYFITNALDNLGSYNTTDYSTTVNNYNRPMYFTGGTPVGVGGGGTVAYNDCNLYDNFHFIENPRNITNSRGFTSRYSRKYLKFTVTIEFTCAEYLAYESDSSIMVNLRGVPTKAIIESIEFDYSKKIAKIRGLI